ncbi:hypothetical protein Arad_9712 [Rhizobium rhizogenes K84]|uniref:Uncharacterized protein n=1 Tax=Rhizobium rhizogenes (strain K84 / ATCC BAA-868) TaxID=311403 RepID=B9JLG4_RHIR8|nr:hypothetical protein Arad_9712 [Rhizobium rhizogenes K84]
MVGELHDHADIVLDEDHRRFILIAGSPDEVRHVALLRRRHARHRLVQKQDLRFGHQGACKLDALLQTIGQRARQPVANMVEMEELKDAHCALARIRRFPTGARKTQNLFGKSRAHPMRQTSDNIVDNAQSLEQGQILKGSAHAEGCQPFGRHMSIRGGADAYMTPVGAIDAADDVDQRALAGAVRPDDRTDLAGLDRQIDVNESHNTAKRQADAVQCEAAGIVGRVLHALFIHRRRGAAADLFDSILPRSAGRQRVEGIICGGHWLSSIRLSGAAQTSAQFPRCVDRFRPTLS